MLEAGDDVVLVIDVQGARKVRRRGLETTTVFVMPPSLRGARAAAARPQQGQRGRHPAAARGRPRGGRRVRRVRLHRHQRRTDAAVDGSAASSSPSGAPICSACGGSCRNAFVRTFCMIDRSKVVQLVRIRRHGRRPRPPAAGRLDAARRRRRAQEDDRRAAGSHHRSGREDRRTRRRSRPVTGIE